MLPAPTQPSHLSLLCVVPAFFSRREKERQEGGKCSSKIHNNHTIYYLWIFVFFANSLELKMTINHMHILRYFFFVFLGPLCKSTLLSLCVFGTSRCIVSVSTARPTPKDMEMTTTPSAVRSLWPTPPTLLPDRPTSKWLLKVKCRQTVRQSCFLSGARLGKLKGNCTFHFYFVVIFPDFYGVFIWQGNTFIMSCLLFIAL